MPAVLGWDAAAAGAQPRPAPSVCLPAALHPSPHGAHHSLPPCRPAAHCHLSPFPSTRLQTSYTGASLLAMSDLGRRLGYTLVGADRSGINAFFVRTDILECQGMQVG